MGNNVPVAVIKPSPKTIQTKKGVCSLEVTVYHKGKPGQVLKQEPEDRN